MSLQEQPQQEIDSDHYIGTDGEEHLLSDSNGAACVDCGFEVGPDGYCEECGQDNNC
jgi:hypothetical protein